MTANKALLAHHGAELYEEARRRGLTLAFEAAVSGGIPLIRAVKEGLVANSILSLAGIGTAASGSPGVSFNPSSLTLPQTATYFSSNGEIVVQNTGTAALAGREAPPPRNPIRATTIMHPLLHG